MRYLVFGTGAVGGLVGARLALAGYPVTFLARPKTAEALRARGLRVIEGAASEHLPEPTVATDLADALAAGRPEAVLLAVKSYDCLAAAQSLRAACGDPPTVVCLLNGIGNEATLGRLLGEGRVVAAALTTAVQSLEPGVVRVERRRGLCLDGRHPLAARLAADMAQAGLAPRLYPDAAAMKWSKLLTNLVANATSAILGWTPRQVFDDPGLYRLEVDALRETVRVVRRMGLRLVNLPGVPTVLLGRTVDLPYAWIQPVLRRAVVGGRGDKLPSFSYDIGRGRSEVAWLNGAVAEHSAAHGLAAPANRLLAEVLGALVEGRADPQAFRGRPQALLEQAARAGVPGVQRYNPPN